MTRSYFFIAMFFVAGVVSAEDKDLKEITNEEVLSYASSEYDKKEMSHKSIVLGIHNSLKLLATFRCSDLCPEYTARILHYDVELESCISKGGAIRAITIPMGWGRGPKEHCIPKILDDNWGKVKF